MTIDFYLDLACTALLTVFEQLPCCQYQKDTELGLNYKEEKRLKYIKWVLWIRMSAGLIFNVAALIAICVVNKEGCL